MTAHARRRRFRWRCLFGRHDWVGWINEKRVCPDCYAIEYEPGKSPGEAP